MGFFYEKNNTLKSKHQLVIVFLTILIHNIKYKYFIFTLQTSRNNENENPLFLF